MIEYGAPFRETRLTKFVAEKVDALSSVKNQRAIAMELGYSRSSTMVSMIRTGQARVPLDKVTPLAKALGVDPIELFKMALEQYWPENGPSMEDVLGEEISANEREILAYIREVSGGTDPALTPRTKEGLKATFTTKTRGELVEALAERKAGGVAVGKGAKAK